MPFLAFSSSKQLGAFPFNRWRMGSLALLFSAVVLLRALFTDHTTFAFPMTDVLLLLLSGFVGVFLGDSALFAALRRLGPRRNAMIFSTHAPMTFFLGWLVLAQIPTTFEWIGVAMIFSGVLLAIFYGGCPDRQAA
ncbi:MAG: DMT family transporter [Alphaproteobacteria bacterium]|nr:DMT family transporter [Alphaproteobacteria bacterium]